MSFIAGTFICAVCAGVLGYVLGLAEGIENERKTWHKKRDADLPPKEDAE